MHLSDWIQAYVHWVHEVYGFADSWKLYDTLCSCVMSIENRSSAYDMELSFFYIIGLLQCVRERWAIPMTNQTFRLWFCISTCTYDKLTNDWPMGIGFFTHLIQSCKQEMLHAERQFLGCMHFDVRVPDHMMTQLRSSLYDTWIQQQSKMPPVAHIACVGSKRNRESSSDLICEERYDFRYL